MTAVSTSKSKKISPNHGYITTFDISVICLRISHLQLVWHQQTTPRKNSTIMTTIKNDKSLRKSVHKKYQTNSQLTKTSFFLQFLRTSYLILFSKKNLSTQNKQISIKEINFFPSKNFRIVISILARLPTSISFFMPVTETKLIRF